MAGIKALFNNAHIMSSLNEFKKRANENSLQTLQYVGNEFVNKARLLNTYLDDTGNLRSSIGYIILQDGKVVDMDFKSSGSDGDTGKLKGMKIAEEIADLHPSGFVLIGVAGMEYARHVEAMGLDVITGSAPESNELKAIFNEIQF